MIENKESLLNLIERADSFNEVKNSGLLPEPDFDEGYYFISYSHKDYKHVLKDIVAFQERGIKVWYDRGLESGKSWLNEVKKKMSSYYCKGIVFYLSENYFASDSCMKELAHAAATMKKSHLLVKIDVDVDERVETLAEKIKTIDEKAYVFADLFFLVASQLDYASEIEAKIGEIERFLEPELLEYTHVYGAKKGVVGAVNLLLGKLAFVENVIDKNVRKVVIPEKVTIDGKTFTVAGITSNAFAHCEQLEEVEMGDGWMMLGESAFFRCPSLRTVKLGKPLKRLGVPIASIDRIFDQCPQAKLELSHPHVNYAGAFKNRDDVVEVDYPKHVRFSDDCFSGCKNLKRAIVKKTDLYEKQTFKNCPALESVTIDKKNRTLFSRESFYGCKKLKEITLNKIHYGLVGTFGQCESLEKVTLYDHVREIDERTFENCRSLKEFRIPKRVYMLKKNAFLGCDSLKTVISDAKKYTFLVDRMYGYRSGLDEIFSAAEKFYIKKLPKDGEALFKGNFVEQKSDKKGYKLFVKEGVR